VSEAERRLRAGELAVLPTDTVYGVGCAAYLADACKRLYRLKERPLEQPTALVLGSVDTLLEHVLPELLGRAGVLCRALLPGPVTLVVPNPGRRFVHLCGESPERIGVRVPVLLPEVAALADAVGGLCMSSANLRGGPEPARLVDVSAEVRSACGLTIDGGTVGGSPSTVVDVTGPEPVLLRAGAAADQVMARVAAAYAG
jgi:L-threonylcarbamoyladenylate synthase